ncbi:MAG TPA: glucose 1-dehydrogenase, partial [Gammaproteobacteria bacterium]|nr:glucose 1-dehydrogenase [Gammaproteobacteria bacterium]
MPGQAAIVTGGGQGIGKAIAADLLARGWCVAIADADSQAGQQAAAELQSTGDVLFVSTDVSREADVGDMVAAVVDRFGHVDALVNNAAISRNKPLAELSLEEWTHVLSVNLTGALLCSKHAAPHLDRRRGSIVNIASTRALMSEPGTEAYSASKGGLVALTHALAVSLGPGVRVNCVSPGWIDTTPWKTHPDGPPPALTEVDHRQHPAGRVGRPEDVAAMVRYLISPEARFVTGANLVIDG